MKCSSFPQCCLNCQACPEYVPDNTPKDELKSYVEDMEADSYLCSPEFHEQNYCDEPFR